MRTIDRSRQRRTLNIQRRSEEKKKWGEGAAEPRESGTGEQLTSERIKNWEKKKWVWAEREGL